MLPRIQSVFQCFWVHSGAALSMVWTSCSSLLYHKEEDFICLFVFVCLDSTLSTLFFLKLFWANKQTSLSWQDFVYSCQTHSLISWIHFYCLHFIKLPWKKIYCCWSWGQQFSILLLLIAFSALPSIPPKVSSPKPGRGGPVLDAPLPSLLPVC